jgi:hypothetical protein
MTQAAQGGASGGSSSNIWLWLGGGCAVILLFGAVLLLFGAYKGVTCCQEAIEKHNQAQQFSIEFADRLRAGDVDGAYERLTPRYRERLTREKFGEMVQAHGAAIEGTLPVPLGMERQMGDQSGGRPDGFWKASVGFMPKRGKTFVVMQLDLVAEGDGDGRIFRVDEIGFQERERDLESEPPAGVVRRLHAQLTDNNPAGAQKLVVGGGADAGESAGVWSFVESRADQLASDRLEILGVHYRPDGTADVEAVHLGESGDELIVGYQVERRKVGWRITGLEFEPTGVQYEEGAEKSRGSNETETDTSSPDAGGDPAPDSTP